MGMAIDIGNWGKQEFEQCSIVLDLAQRMIRWVNADQGTHIISEY
jgi:hypothetical protein